MALFHRLVPFALAGGLVAASVALTSPADARVTPPTLLLPNISANEGASGTASFVVNVGLSSPNPFDHDVTVEVVDFSAVPLPGGGGTYGTATPGVDYVAFAPFDLTFAPGQQVATFPVKIKGDRVAEGLEEIDVRFDDTEFHVGDNDIDLVIGDDDTAPLTKKPLLLLPNQVMPEPDTGCFPYKVSTMLDRPAPSRRHVDAVDFTQVPLPPPLVGTYGTATPGSDYVGFGTRTLTFRAATRVANLPVTICGDAQPEGLEEIDVRFDNTTTIAIGDNDIDLVLSD